MSAAIIDRYLAPVRANRYPAGSLSSTRPGSMLRSQVDRIRAGTECRYEREHPGELMHTDVRKLGRLPDGGGWRAGPEQSRQNHATGKVRVGYDYVHVAVDDHSRPAYAEVPPNETGATSAAFIRRAAAFMAENGAPVQRVMTDNAWAYMRSKDFARALADLGAKRVRTKPRHPWQNGKAERFHHTLRKRWAYRQPFTDNEARTNALKPWLDFYN